MSFSNVASLKLQPLSTQVKPCIVSPWLIWYVSDEIEWEQIPPPRLKWTCHTMFPMRVRLISENILFFLDKFQNYGEFSPVSNFYHFQDKRNYVCSQKKSPRLIWKVVSKTGW